MKTINRLFLIILTCCTTFNLYASSIEKNSTSNNSFNESKDEDKEESKSLAWEFDSSTPVTFDSNTTEKAEKHEFGSKVACLKVLMDEYYITQEEIVPGDPMRRTIIKKSNVYNTTRKIEKHLKKEVKKGNISVENASNLFTHILEVALAIVDEANTKDFEDNLDAKKKNINDQIALFNQVKINSIYYTASNN